MGTAARSLLDLFVKASSWIFEPCVTLASEIWMSTFDGGETCPACCLPLVGHHCHSCGRTFSELRECGERLQLHDSPTWPPTSPQLDFKHNELSNLAELHKLSSSTHLTFSSYRSDEEDDGNGSEKHFVSPTSEFSQNVSDVDSVNISCSQDSLSFKSVYSSPCDSPSRPGDNEDSPSSKVVNSYQEVQVYSNKPGAEVEDSYYLYDNLSPYYNQKSKTFDFEDDVRILYPPPPEDVNHDMENGYFQYIDEDNDLEGSGVDFSCNYFSSNAFPVREKLTDPNKEHLENAVRRHFTALVLQLLKDENIQFSSESVTERWLEVISSLAWQAAKFVKPDTRKGGSMDPSNYVKVKCVISGNPCDSTFIKGVVCRKNVKHKRMVSQHKNPRILLLGGALEYQGVSNKLASINTVIEEERDHLKMAVAKIEAHRPNVLLVEKSVSSYAQEYLLAKEISLVLNVKRSNLERISRCTGAQLVPSVDYINSAQLGLCEVFRVEKVVEDCAFGTHSSKKSVKSLMFFEGCPRRLGCTIILRGALLGELKKVKHVVSLAIFAAHCILLETSFLANEGATVAKLPSKVTSSIPDNLVIADAAMMKTSFFGGPTVIQPTAENHNKVSLCSSDGIQRQFLSSDTSCLNEGILDIAIKQNDRSGSAILELKDISTLYTHNSLDVFKSSTDSAGECKTSTIPNPIDAIIQIGDCLVCDKRDIATYKHLIAADELAGRNDDLEVPEEYFSTADSQSILVSFSSSCIPKGTVCERSQLFRMKFYGNFDKPLGKYLREDLFDQTSICRSCNEPIEAHIQNYTHQQGSLTISVRRLTSMKLPGERDGRIWMWHRCLKCEPKDGIPPATHRVVMSDAAWGLSFGKFLELSFSNHTTANRLASCGHSLQKDCLRFYGFGNLVAFFRYSPVDILSVCLPPLVLDFSCHAMQGWLRSEAILIQSSLNSVHLEVFNFLEQIELKVKIYDNNPVKATIHKHILELKDVLREDRNEYDVFLKSVSTENEPPSQGILDILELNRLKRKLLIDSILWDRRLCLLDSFSKSKSSRSNVQPQVPEDFIQIKQKAVRSDSDLKDEGLSSSTEESTACSLIFSENWSMKQHEEVSMQVLECNTSNFVEMDLSIETVEGYVGSAGLNLVSGHCYRGYVGQVDFDGSTDTLFSKSIMSPVSNLSDRIDLAWIGSNQSLTDQVTSNESDPSVGHLSLMNSSSYRKPTSTVRVNSFDSALRLRNKLHRGSSPLSLRFSSVKSFDTARVSDGMASIPFTHQAFFCKSPSSMKRLHFLASHTPVFISTVSCVTAEGARLLIPQGQDNDVVIALYDNEPTSIISYAISSQEHAKFISCRKIDKNEMNLEDDKVSVGLSFSSVSQFQSDNSHHPNYCSNESNLLQKSRIVDHKELHFKFSFHDDYSNKYDRVIFSVKCYYAKQFDALRKKCCKNDLDFIRSLSRCKKWSAQGGKSNVYFAKSLDERFIIKQVTKTELDSFDDFALEYFNYLTESISSRSPTCLAKVLGIYQVTVKHLKGGREVKMDLMVMENLFYGRNISRVYDLKGSLRARYNADSSGTNKVLLDLNLLETLRTKPILLSSKAKRKLERAIWNDTSFLASIHVMDYSLLVGVDERNKDLVVGIIDYLRQYTWDKHLETWVKASGILGGLKYSSPTVVSPLQYKKRFRKAMSMYFLTVPDQWSS